MVKYSIYTFLVMSFLFCALSQDSYAQEKLSFNNQISDVQEALLRVHIKNFDDFDIAKIDLNYDGIFEFIAKRKECGSTKTLCDFQILGEAPDGKSIIQINLITAYDLAISKGSAHGVRDLAAFQNVLNDFDYNIYRWDAKSGQYHQEIEKMTRRGK